VIRSSPPLHRRTETRPVREGRSAGQSIAASSASFNTRRNGHHAGLSKPKARRTRDEAPVPWADIVVESFTPKRCAIGTRLRKFTRAPYQTDSCSRLHAGADRANALYPGFGQLRRRLSGVYNLSGYGPGSCAPPRGIFGFHAPVVQHAHCRRTRLSQPHGRADIDMCSEEASIAD